MDTFEFDPYSWSHYREGNRFEAKAAQGGLPESLWQTYSAFANTNGGMIVLGLEESRTHGLSACGVKNPDHLVKLFWDAANNPSKVSANVLSSQDVEVAEVDGRSVVAIRVPRADRNLRPVFVKGNPFTGTYRRNGEGDYLCTRSEIEGMIRDASPEPGDAAVLDGFDLEECLDRETVRSYRSALKAAKPNHPWAGEPDDDLLLRLGAAARVPGEQELRPTRAGLLMFGREYMIVREFPDFFLDYRDVRSDRRWDDRVVSNDGEWSGNVFDFWLKVSRKLTVDLRRPFALDGDFRRVDDTSMHRAVREGLANCLIHADYYGRRYVVVVKRDDRVEYANPGALRLAREVVMQGGTSDARNPMLMKMFGLLNVCEKAGSGFDALRRASEEFDAPAPELTESFQPDRTSLVLHLGSAADGPAAAGSRAARRAEAESGAGATPEGVLRMVEECGSVTRADVDERFGASPAKSKRLLSGLVKAGLVSMRGKGRATRYVPSGQRQGS